MRLSREKIVRISHLAVDVIAGFDEVEFIEDRNTVRLEREGALVDDAARRNTTGSGRSR